MVKNSVYFFLPSEVLYGTCDGSQTDACLKHLNLFRHWLDVALTDFNN